ncbi:MAG: DUF3788 family protein [Thermoanaerobaculia bacterium]
MALSFFDDKSAPPSEGALQTALGPSSELWRELIQRISVRFPPLDEVWGFSSKSTGWGLRLKHRERTVLYMTPCKDYFLASFALGEKAVRVAQESRLPRAVLNVIDRSPRYAEGRGVRLEIRKPRDLSAVETLAAAKMAN